MLRSVLIKWFQLYTLKSSGLSFEATDCLLLVRIGVPDSVVANLPRTGAGFINVHMDGIAEDNGGLRRCGIHDKAYPLQHGYSSDSRKPIDRWVHMYSLPFHAPQRWASLTGKGLMRMPQRGEQVIHEESPPLI